MIEVTSSSPRAGLLHLRSLFIVLALLAAFVVTPGLGLAEHACAQEGSFAVFIQGSAVDIDPYCVDFEEGMNGLEALEATGVEVVTKSSEFGELICKIGDVGTDDCAEDAGAFWAYYHGTEAGEWEFSEVGADAFEPAAGGVDGWVWQDFEEESIGPAADPDFDEACLAAAQDPTSDEAEGAEEEGSSLLSLWIAIGIAVVVGGGYLIFRGRSGAAT